MNQAIFPLAFASDEFRLLTGIVLGFLFGFTLERAGFGNARKLAAQFYLNDMTVFKVMFTAILVAMVGLYGLSALGFVDLSMVWINPTFTWAQVVGGFLLGVGFIMSGLCPGTSVVAMASGRIDGWVTFGGIFAGIGLFTLTVDWVPGLHALYEMGSGEVSVLHEVFGIPALVLALLVLAGALAAFVGAEKVEAFFQQKRPPVELTPSSRPRLKFAMGGALGLSAIVALALSTPRSELPPIQMASMAPLSLAESIIEREPGLLILDLRADQDSEKGIPGAIPAGDEEEVLQALTMAPPRTTIVVYDDTGRVFEAPGTWPRTLEYLALEGGLEGWVSQVLTPLDAAGLPMEQRDTILRQNQISAFFSGAAVNTSSVAAPPPAMQAAGAPKKKKAGGC
ncbi:YeeE/YedE thiosulfate transporter family protein [Gemmatimonadota bacterium]